ncbi:unnamed protein product [Cunninghamella blakesleeana]
MGCCMSTEEPTIHEVVFDEKGIAHQVPKGQGTHLIHVYPDQETNIEKKTQPFMVPVEYSQLPKPETVYYPKQQHMKKTIIRPSATSKRVHPLNYPQQQQQHQQKEQQMKA